MGFEDKFKQLESYVEATSLAVFVWGPGKGGREHYTKRKKVREIVQTTFPKAEIRFSEDKDLKKMIPGAEDLSTPQQELWHLAACDVCVVLDTSKGAGEEIAHFVNSKDAYKLLIFTHKKYERRRSFPAELRQNHNQLFYSDKEYTSCSLVERIVNRLKYTALSKMTLLKV